MKLFRKLVLSCLTLSLASYLNGNSHSQSTEDSFEHLKKIKRTMNSMLENVSHEFGEYVQNQYEYQKKKQEYEKDRDVHASMCMMFPLAPIFAPLAIHKHRECKKYKKKIDKSFLDQHRKSDSEETSIASSLNEVCFEGCFDRTDQDSEPELEKIKEQFGNWLNKNDLLTLAKEIMGNRAEIYKWSVQEKTKHIECSEERQKEFKHYSNLKTLRRYFTQKLEGNYREQLGVVESGSL